MRRLLLAAAGLLLATAAVQAQPAQLAATQPDVHAHVATSLRYHQEPEAHLSPLVTHPAPPAVAVLAPYPVSVHYFPHSRTFRPHVEVTERTYVIVEASVPTPPPQARKW